MTAAVAYETSVPRTEDNNPDLYASLTCLCDQPRTLVDTLGSQFHDDVMAWREAKRLLPHGAWVRLAEFERNGRDDSDWYSIVLHTPTGTLMTVATGTTRAYDPPTGYDAFFGKPTEEHLSVARERWAQIAAGSLAGRDAYDCATPGVDFFKQGGVEVTTLRQCNVTAHTHERKTCPKCDGSGRYNKGRRGGECYYCKGVGHFDNVHKVKGEDGKPVKVKIPAGSRAVTLGPSQAFGTFYANGYNRPNRGNSRVLAKLEDGTAVYLSLDALRLTREPASYETKLVEMKVSAATLKAGDMRWFFPFGYFPF